MKKWPVIPDHERAFTVVARHGDTGVTIAFRRGTKREWFEKDPLLGFREIGVESDTGKFKLGNGENTWRRLPYYGDLLEPSFDSRVAEALDLAEKALKWYSLAMGSGAHARETRIKIKKLLGEK